MLARVKTSLEHGGPGGLGSRSVGILHYGLIDRHPELPSRDALHAATALQRGMEVVVSADADFDMVLGLRRVDPLDRTAVATLTS